MESSDGFEVELDNGTAENAPEANGFNALTNKENEIVQHGSDAVHATNCSEDTSKVEVRDSPRRRDDGSVSTTENKASNPTKKGASDKSTQLKKTPKSSALLNGSFVEPHKKRNILSQSLSFPSKGSRMFTNSRRQSTVTSSIKNAALAAKATTSSTQKKLMSLKFGESMPILGQAENIGSVEATINDTSDTKSNDSKTKPSRQSLPAKLDDDAHSTASSSTPHTRKSSSCGFSFRLDERAEKRKEFFMKLEEKNHAKEMEKTNLHAKSKENQDAEIRQLRKSLTFKATPMPSFYQEPGPPKVELNKIPPTRARSPKLGRRKEFAPATKNTSEAGNSCKSPLLTPSSTKMNDDAASRKGDAIAPKNPKQKSLSKLSLRKAKAMKSVTKSGTTDDACNQKAKLEPVCKIVDSENRRAEFSASTIDEMEPAFLEDRIEQEKTAADFPEIDSTHREVPLQG